MIFWAAIGAIFTLLVILLTLISFPDKDDDFGIIYITYIDDVPTMRLEINSDRADDLMIHKVPKQAKVRIKIDTQVRE